MNENHANAARPRPAFEASFDPGGERPSNVLVRAIAVANDEDPLRLPPLLSVVDPDALDACMSTDRSGTTIRFPYAGYRVEVSADGRIALFEG